MGINDPVQFNTTNLYICNKKIQTFICLYVYIYVDIYFGNKYRHLYIFCNKFILQHIILLYPRVVRSIESQPFHVNLVTPLAQYILHEVYIRISHVVQLVLVERSSDRFAAIAIEYIDYGISIR